MTISRRDALKIGLGAGVLPLVPRPLQGSRTPARTGEGELTWARPLPLSRVRLTGGPLKAHQDRDARYLLELEPDRMLAFYRRNAGLEPKAEGYGGWDRWGRQLTGHIGGHYLSAVSFMYAATGDARFKERVDYIVDELALVQDAFGDGFLSALEGGRDCFGRLARGEIETQSFDLNGQWAPWYTLHKTYAGLRDAYRYTGNRKALDVEVKFAGWAEGVLARLTEDQLEHMMNCEFGGMNEVFVDLYADTGDERWLGLSYKFEHDDFLQPLKRHVDNLPGKHGNTAVPKILGSADRYTLLGRPEDWTAASFFFDTVASYHTFATGGHGKDEYFGPREQFSERIDGRTAESCNVYNMLKLARQLFSLNPDVHYADFHERALYNHVMASMDPETGEMCYMVPVGQGVSHEYQNMFQSFTCCVGSGMESHALHGDGLYYEAGARLFVNLYAPSTAEWADAGVKLTMDSDFPMGETAKLTLAVQSPREFTLSLRRPWWAGDGYGVKVNGQPVPVPDNDPAEWRERSQYPFPADAGSTYVDVRRTWRSGDVVEIALPKSLRVEATPDDPRVVSILWGPLVLAGDLGPRRQRGRRAEDAVEAPLVVPVFVHRDEPVEAWVRPVPGQPGRFRAEGRVADAGGAARTVELAPFHQLHQRTYATYWDLFTPEEWAGEKARYQAEAERLAALDAVTVAYLQPAEPAFEEQFNYRGAEDASRYQIEGRAGRRARTWFSYDIPVEPASAMTVILTMHGEDRRHTPADFQIMVDSHVIGEQRVVREDGGEFFDVAFTIPEAFVQGKNSVELRFQAKPDSQIPTIFAVRMIRGTPPGR